MDAAGPSSSLRSPALVFETSGSKTELDPQIDIMVRRAMGARRASVHVDNFIIRAAKLHDYYKGQNMGGTKTELEDIKALKPHAPAGDKGRDNKLSQCKPHGPVGYLITSTCEYGMAMDNQLTIYQHQELPLPIMLLPHQQIKPLVSKAAARGRMLHAQETRTNLTGIKEMDTQVYQMAMRKRKGDDRRTLLWATNGSGLSETKLCAFGLSASSKCPFCPCEVQTFEHIIFACPAFIDERLAGPTWLRDFDLQSLPAYIKQGIPKALCADIQRTYWGDTWEQPDLAGQVGMQNAYKTDAGRKAMLLLERLDEEDKLLNARQFFQKLLGGLYEDGIQRRRTGFGICA